jgi:hypothetical protein
MSILNFEDDKKSKNYSNKSSQHKRFKAILGIGAVALSISLGSTLAANINLNSGTPVEFGQGVATTMACDNSVFITPNSEFVNDANYPGFKFTSFTVSGIGNECIGKVFTIKAYKNGQSDPLNLYMVNAGDSFNQVQVFRSQVGYVFVGAGAFAAGLSSSTEDSFTITFATSDVSGVVQVTTIPLASAEDVDRMTIESRDSSNVASASESFVRVQDTSDAGNLTSSEDVDGSTSVVNDGTGYVNVLVKNGDGDNLSTSGALVATATNGAVIAWNTVPTWSSFAVRFEVSGVLYVKQGSANANDLTSTTITVSFNGINLATKTITFAGGDSDPGPDEPETRSIFWDDACPGGPCSVPSFGGQQTYVLGGDGPPITDFPSDPQTYGWTFEGWVSNFASDGYLTMTGTWSENDNGGGGVWCDEWDPFCSP